MEQEQYDAVNDPMFVAKNVVTILLCFVGVVMNPLAIFGLIRKPVVRPVMIVIVGMAGADFAGCFVKILLETQNILYRRCVFNSGSNDTGSLSWCYDATAPPVTKYLLLINHTSVTASVWFVLAITVERCFTTFRHAFRSTVHYNKNMRALCAAVTVISVLLISLIYHSVFNFRQNVEVYKVEDVALARFAGDPLTHWDIWSARCLIPTLVGIGLAVALMIILCIQSAEQDFNQYRERLQSQRRRTPVFQNTLIVITLGCWVLFLDTIVASFAVHIWLRMHYYAPLKMKIILLSVQVIMEAFFIATKPFIYITSGVEIRYSMFSWCPCVKKRRVNTHMYSFSDASTMQVRRDV